MTETSAGRAPWPMSTVGAHFEIQLGKMLDSARNLGEPKPYLGNRAVQWGHIDLAAAGTVPLTKEDRARFRLRRNDLLVCEGGEVGRAAIWREQLPECYYQKALHRLRPKSGFDPRIMMALLRYWSEIGRFRNFVTQTSIAHLPRDKFLTMPLPEIPPREQERIAEVLVDAETLVRSLEILVKKKKKIKQALMQRLFHEQTSRRAMAREPLGTVTSWLSGGTPDRARTDYWSGTIPWISASTLQALSVSSSDQLVTTTAVRRSSRMAPVGSTLCLVRGSALHSEIRAAFVTAPVCFNQDLKALIPHKRLVPKFLTYSIHANAANLLQLVTSAGNTAGVLETQTMKRFEIWLPDRPEQQRIVNLLDDLESDLEGYDVRLKKADDIKRGLLQELLSGRTRLPVEEMASA